MTMNEPERELLELLVLLETNPEQFRRLLLDDPTVLRRLAAVVGDEHWWLRGEALLGLMRRLRQGEDPMRILPALLAQCDEWAAEMHADGEPAEADGWLDLRLRLTEITEGHVER